VYCLPSAVCLPDRSFRVPHPPHRPPTQPLQQPPETGEPGPAKSLVTSHKSQECESPLMQLQPLSLCHCATVPLSRCVTQLLCQCLCVPASLSLWPFRLKRCLRSMGSSPPHSAAGSAAPVRGGGAHRPRRGLWGERDALRKHALSQTPVAVTVSLSMRQFHCVAVTLSLPLCHHVTVPLCTVLLPRQVPVVEGYAYTHLTKRLSVAGRQVTQYLIDLLLRQG